MKQQHYLIGASGHSLILIEIIECCGNQVKGLFDIDLSKKSLVGYPVINWEERQLDSTDLIIIAIGNNFIRRRVASQCDEFSLNYGIAIHPSAQISSRADIGFGTAVMAGVSINSMTHIGEHCIINTNASIDHECILEDFVHISPNTALCGNVYVGEGTHIGAGSVVIPGIKIGKWATIGAGSVVIKDVPDYATVVGNPGRIIKIGNNE